MGIFSWLTEKFGGKKAAIRYLERVAFDFTLGAGLPPKGSYDYESNRFRNQVQGDFCWSLSEASMRATKFREDWLRNMEGQAAVQGYPGVISNIAKDPVDCYSPDWFALAILFDYEKMDSSYGVQVLNTFFKRVDPMALSKRTIIAHFGDLIKFGTFCSIMLKAQSPIDLALVASKFGPDFNSVGLVPHTIRFLYSNRIDGNIIARIFSLPIVAVLLKGDVYPDPKAGVNWIMEEAIKETNWKISKETIVTLP